MPKRRKMRGQDTVQQIKSLQALVKLPCPARLGRWTKAQVIIDALEIECVKRSTFDVRPLLKYARKCLKTYGNRGHIFIEYGWRRFQNDGVVVSEQEILAAMNSGKLIRWYESECGGREGVVKTELVAECSNPALLKRQMRKRKRRESQGERWARIGREYREAQALSKERAKADAQRLAAQVEQTKAEAELLEGFRRMLREGA